MSTDDPGAVQPTPTVALTRRILAHELGHVLTNQDDVETANHVFFHSLGSRPDDVPKWWRRISHATEVAALAERPSPPANAPPHVVEQYRKYRGNKVLKPYAD